MVYLNEKGNQARHDVCWNRWKAFQDAGIRAHKAHFDHYVHKMELIQIATHPDYQRRGYAKALCQWGMECARNDKVPVTVNASPMGCKLFSNLGFKSHPDDWIQVEGEEEKLINH